MHQLLRLRPRRRRIRARAARLPAREAGFTLIELLGGMTMTLVVVSATSFALLGASRAQNRDQSYQVEIQTAQVALARLVHDLREATSFSLSSGAAPTQIQPGVIEFQLQQGGTTYNVEYNCNAPDTLGRPYTRCARTQAIAPTLPPAAGSTPGPLDIQHVWNNPSNTSDLTSGYDYSAFCRSDGTAPSGSVFFPENPNTQNTDSSPPACDSAYELEVARDPDYVQVRVDVPASGDTSSGGLKHHIVLQDGAYLQNVDWGA